MPYAIMFKPFRLYGNVVSLYLLLRFDKLSDHPLLNSSIPQILIPSVPQFLNSSYPQFPL